MQPVSTICTSGLSRLSRGSASELAGDLVFCGLADDAGVEHDHVGLSLVLGRRITDFLEHGRDFGAIGLVHLAADSPDMEPLASRVLRLSNELWRHIGGAERNNGFAHTLLGSMVHANRDEFGLCRRHSRQLYTVASMRSCPGVPCVTTSCGGERTGRNRAQQTLVDDDMKIT